MAFQNGLSGLNAAARNLDVIGNNVANANTVGAKAARAEFADLYAASLSGVRSANQGIGVTTAAVVQQFTQGDISATNSALDMAVNGHGFFRMSNGGELSYSRNGQFQLDKDGYVVNAQGGRLTGYPADSKGVIGAGVPTELRLQTGDIAPNPTSEARITVNLDARAEAPGAAFDPADGTSYNGATPIPVYDSQGAEHTVALYFRKLADNSWEVHAAVDGALTGSAGTPLATLDFGTDGRLDGASASSVNVTVPGPGGSTLTVPVDLSEISQFGSPFSVSELSQDGYGAGRLAAFSVASDGTLLARYTNGRTIPQGRVALATFANPQGLQPVGGNQWVETVDSGSPLIGSPGAGVLGAIQSGAVEQSNVDLTAELVNMITAQRIYQANAQTIRTQDQIMQTIVNLR